MLYRLVTILVVVFGVLFFASAWTIEPRHAASDGLVVSAAGNMNTPRAAHTATRLQDGRVLLAGGCAGDGCSPFTASAELFDPSSGNFSATSPMTRARASHAAALLPDGRVLLTGGWSDGAVTRSAEVFDPAAGSFSSAGEMQQPRASHQAVVLDDGRVLFIGGQPATNEALASTEIFDPSSGEFLPGPALTVPRSSFDAVKLEDGRVLVIGGHTDGGKLLASAEIIDLRRGRSRPTGAMQTPRHKHAAALLPDGRVLVTGGSSAADYSGRYDSSEIFDPSTGEFRPGPAMHHVRFKHRDSVAPLADGRVLVAGGHPEADVFDAARNRFIAVDGKAEGSLSFATASLLDDGRVLVAGGYDDRIRVTQKAWLYVPKTD